MVLVTGSNGLLGSFICKKLFSEGRPFRAMVREGADVSLLEGVPTVSLVEGDVLDVLSLEKYMEGVDTVIHSAAVVSYVPKEVERMFLVNVEGTRNVVNAALKSGVRRVVHISSIAALGREKNSQWIDEKSKWLDSPLNTPYAKTKHLAEMEAWRGYTEGLETVILNPSLILGPGDWKKSSTQIFKYTWQERPYYSTGTANYVDVRDAADLAFMAMSAQVNGERFIVSAAHLPFKSLLGKIAERFGKKPPSRRITPFLLYLAILFSKVRSFLTGEAPLITKEAAKSSHYHFKYDNSKGISAFSFQYRVLEDTLEWACKELMSRKNK